MNITSLPDDCLLYLFNLPFTFSEKLAIAFVCRRFYFIVTQTNLRITTLKLYDSRTAKLDYVHQIRGLYGLTHNDDIKTSTEAFLSKILVIPVENIAHVPFLFPNISELVVKTKMLASLFEHFNLQMWLTQWSNNLEKLTLDFNFNYRGSLAMHSPKEIKLFQKIYIHIGRKLDRLREFNLFNLYSLDQIFTRTYRPQLQMFQSLTTFSCGGTISFPLQLLAKFGDQIRCLRMNLMMNSSFEPIQRNQARIQNLRHLTHLTLTCSERFDIRRFCELIPQLLQMLTCLDISAVETNIRLYLPNPNMHLLAELCPNVQELKINPYFILNYKTNELNLANDYLNADTPFERDGLAYLRQQLTMRFPSVRVLIISQTFFQIENELSYSAAIGIYFPNITRIEYHMRREDGRVGLPDEGQQAAWREVLLRFNHRRNQIVVNFF